MKKFRTLAALAATVTLAAACSSSHKSSAGSSSGGVTSPGASGGTGGKTITVGIITDLTGPAASGNKTTVEGVTAGAALAGRAGYKIKTVVGDTNTSPGGALSSAQKLVEQDHVDVVIMCSALGFAAAPFLLQQGVPVIGAAEDGPEWRSDNNMFSVFGAIDTTQVSTVEGDFFKMEGVTTVGSVGYSISPASSEAAKAAGVSSQHDGLKVGYLNAALPFGSTNVAPIALAMKNAGVDGVTASTDPNTAFALIAALRQVGDNPKVALLATGYGGDLQQAGTGALNDAQGVYFTTSAEPMEMHTAATQQFQSDLQTAGVNGDPTYAEYVGYMSVAMLVEGLKASGGATSHQALTRALDGLKGFNGAGLLGDHTLDPGNRTGYPGGVGPCVYVTKLSGSTFQLVPNADPICGTMIAGARVSASS